MDSARHVIGYQFTQDGSKCDGDVMSSIHLSMDSACHARHRIPVYTRKEGAKSDGDVMSIIHQSRH